MILDALQAKELPTNQIAVRKSDLRVDTISDKSGDGL